MTTEPETPSETRVIWIARTGESDERCMYLRIDVDATDDEYWRGHTFDNHWVGYPKKEWREVAEPEWNKDPSDRRKELAFAPPPGTKLPVLVFKIPRCQLCPWCDDDAETPQETREWQCDAVFEYETGGEVPGWPRKLPMVDPPEPPAWCPLRTQDRLITFKPFVPGEPY